MLKLRRIFTHLLPLLLWMAIIFSASSDRMSFQHTSRIIGPFVHWLLPGLSEERVHAVVTVVRKGAHLTEYAVLGLLAWRLWELRGEGPATWSWRRAGLVLLLVVFYAATDEFHQMFVPSREASVWDVLIDTSGGAFGLIFVLIFRRWGKRL